MSSSFSPLAFLQNVTDVMKGAAQNAAHAEWRDSVRAELALLPRAARHTLPFMVQMRRGERTTLLEVVQQNAQGIHVAPRVDVHDPGGIRLFRRHVLGRSDELPGGGHQGGAAQGL